MLTDQMSAVPFLLHDVSQHIRYAFEARARSIGVTRPQYRVLLYLARHDGPTQSEIADALDVERITLGRMVDRMSEAGLIERRADPADRRVWRVHMLPAAEGMVEQLSRIGGAIEHEAMTHLTEAERLQLKQLLFKLRDGLKATRCDRRRAVA